MTDEEKLCELRRQLLIDLAMLISTPSESKLKNNDVGEEGEQREVAEEFKHRCLDAIQLVKNLQKVSIPQINLKDKCSICQEPLRHKSRVIDIVNPCHHAFHLQCLKGWTNIQKKTCPNCKGAVQSRCCIKKKYLLNLHNEEGELFHLYDAGSDDDDEYLEDYELTDLVEVVDCPLETSEEESQTIDDNGKTKISDDEGKAASRQPLMSSLWCLIVKKGYVFNECDSLPAPVCMAAHKTTDNRLVLRKERDLQRSSLRINFEFPPIGEFRVASEFYEPDLNVMPLILFDIRYSGRLRHIVEQLTLHRRVLDSNTLRYRQPHRPRGILVHELPPARLNEFESEGTNVRRSELDTFHASAESPSHLFNADTPGEDHEADTTPPSTYEEEHEADTTPPSTYEEDAPDQPQYSLDSDTTHKKG